jgi:hypothetical protein
VPGGGVSMVVVGGCVGLVVVGGVVSLVVNVVVELLGMVESVMISSTDFSV